MKQTSNIEKLIKDNIYEKVDVEVMELSGGLIIIKLNVKNEEIINTVPIATVNTMNGAYNYVSAIVGETKHHGLN